jgi:hypothetical protein
MDDRAIVERYVARVEVHRDRAFAINTTDANELVADIHDRMPLILAPHGYARLAERRVQSARIDAAVPRRPPCGCGRSRPASTGRRMTTLNRGADRSGHAC